jgi:hypothetical protein
VSFASKCWHWLRAFYKWFIGEWRLWMLVAVPAIVLSYCSLLPTKNEDWLRISGWLLEVTAIAVLIHGLSAKRVLFNKDGIAKQLRDAFSRFPEWPGQNKTVAISGVAAMSFAGSLGTLTGTAAPPGNAAPLDQRVAHLEAQLANLQKDYNGLVDEVRRQADAAKAAVDAERRARDAAAQELESKVRELGAGGIQVEFAGVLWLLLGATLATVPGEIVYLWRLL